MQPHPERMRVDGHQAGRFHGSESEKIDEHERFAIRPLEPSEGVLEVDPLIVVGREIGHISALECSRPVEQPSAAGFEEHVTSDPEEPVEDRAVTPIPKGCPAGTNERLLGELLRVVAVSHDPKEVREDRPLVLTEDILKFHGICPSSTG